MMSLNWKKSDVARSFYQADKDGDGNLDLEEYVSMFQEMVYQSFKLPFHLVS